MLLKESKEKKRMLKEQVEGLLEEASVRGVVVVVEVVVVEVVVKRRKDCKRKTKS